MITHREKKPFECRADGCGKSYCDARSLRRHQDNHHAPPGSLAGTNQQPPLSPSLNGLGSSLPSRSTSSASSSNAALFISELSGGSPDLVMPSVGSSQQQQHYPAPSSNNSTTSNGGGSGHFQTADGQQQFGGWASNGVTSSIGHDSVVSLDSSCNIQYGPSGSSVNGGYNSSCPADNQEVHQVTWAPSVPAESVSPSKSGKKPTNSAGIKMVADRQNKVDVSGNNHKIPSTTIQSTPATATAAAVKSTKKTKGSTTTKMQQNGKVAGLGAGTKNNNGNSKKIAADSSIGANNDGLTTQQLELIQEIMRQTQEQHRLMQEEQQQHKPAQTSSHHSSNGGGPTTTTTTTKTKKTNNKAVKWTPPAASTSDSNPLANVQPATTSTNSASATGGVDAAGVSGRPVECNVCQRRFKNTPALNGHMRLHGGFLKKEAECNGANGSGNGSGGGSSGGSSGGGGGGSGSGGGGGSSKKPGESKKDPNTPPLLTASVSVRALIEEKIIQRRNNMAANNPSTNSSSGSSSGSSGTTCSTSVSAATASSSSSSTSSVAVVVQQQEQHSHALPISVQTVSQPEASVMLMDVLEEDQRDAMEAQSQQPLIPKLEPEGYFEGVD